MKKIILAIFSCVIIGCSTDIEKIDSDDTLTSIRQKAFPPEEFHPPENWQGSYEFVDSVLIIHNPQVGLHEENFRKRIRLVEDLVIDDNIRGLTWNIKADYNGNMYVVYLSNSNETIIRKYDNNGLFIMDIRKKDNKRFKGVDITLDAESNLITHEPKLKFSFFDSNGKHLVTKSLTSKYVTPIRFVMTDSGYFFFTLRKSNRKWERQDTIGYMSKDFKSRKIIYMRLRLPSNIFEEIPIPFYTPYSRFSKKWYANSLEYVFVADSTKYEIDSYNLDGKLIKKITRTYYDWVKVINYDKELLYSLYFSRYGSGISKKMRNKIKQEYKFPEFKPAIERLFIDDQEMLWVQTYERNEDGLKGIDLFDEQGIYLQRIWGEAFPSDVKNDYVYSILNDRRLVKRYKIKRVTNSSSSP